MNRGKHLLGCLMLVVFSLTAFYGCSSETQYDEVILQTYPNGKPRVVGYYVETNHGKELVKKTWFNIDGTIKKEENYSDASSNLTEKQK